MPSPARLPSEAAASTGALSHNAAIPANAATLSARGAHLLLKAMGHQLLSHGLGVISAVIPALGWAEPPLAQPLPVLFYAQVEQIVRHRPSSAMLLARSAGGANPDAPRCQQCSKAGRGAQRGSRGRQQRSMTRNEVRRQAEGGAGDLDVLAGALSQKGDERLGS